MITEPQVAETPPVAAPASATATNEPKLYSGEATLIEPSRGWQVVDAGELWRYRELMAFLAWRDVKVRYKQTLLGAAWAVLQPALMMVVFTIFFSRMAGVSSGTTPYPLFAFAGLLPWTFFSTAVANAGNSVVGSERLISKVYFPRLVVPFAAVGAAAMDFFIATGLMALMMVYYGIAPGPQLFLAPLVFGVIAVAALGIGTLLAALNVSYRDFRYVIPFLLQLWMFATPSLYMDLGARPAKPTVPVAAGSTPAPAPATAPVPATAEEKPRLPSPFAPSMLLNPMTGLIGAFRAAVLGGPIPWASFAISSAFAVLALVVGCLYFRRVEDTLADII